MWSVIWLSMWNILAGCVFRCLALLRESASVPRWVVVGFVIVVVCTFGRGPCRVASADGPYVDRPDVARALKSALSALREGMQSRDRSHLGLNVYACLKLGLTPEDRQFAVALNKIASYCGPEGYVGGKNPDHSIYVAGIEAMLLADAGGDQYQKELEVLRDFLVSRQNDHGSWTYQKGGSSDMSVTQYAILGLWAAERAGANVEKVVWAKAAKFLLGAQWQGAYTYRARRNERADLNMTGAGLSSLIICRKYLAGGFNPASTRAARAATDDATIRYGILRPVVVEDEEEEERDIESPIDPNLRVTRADLDQAIRAATDWVDGRFRPTGDKAAHLAYYYYTIERAGALTRREKFANKDWYDTCADALLPQQHPTGTWDLDSYDKYTDTAMIALFLARPTRKLTGAPVVTQIGGGLLSGGRGLPSDLTQFGKPASETKKPQTALEELLSDLSEATDTELPKLQQDLVSQIQVGDRDELIGQRETLAKLVTHPDAQVRRTALWAMGRTGDLRLARYAIAALDDVSPLVLTEARNALAWIARRPEAFGHAEDPLYGVPPGATLEQKQKAIEMWREGMIEDWGRWYLESSPYNERFDEFDLNLRARLAK